VRKPDNASGGKPPEAVQNQPPGESAGSRGPHRRDRPRGVQTPSIKSDKPFLPRWALIALCLLVAGGGTWAVFEFFVWPKIPPELVGKWVIEGGLQDGSTFDFSRNGDLEAHLNVNGMEHILKGKAAVEDKKLHITTRNPNTKQDETQTCVIRELTKTTFVVEFSKGEVFKMVRVD
jgi:uncharacterized protein (TIGR03066 family)